METTIPIQSGPYKTFRNLNEDETFIEYEGSTITIPIQATLPNGNVLEEKLKLAAFMRLEVFPAYINQLGTREFQFIIRDWELYGYSKLLNELFMGNPRGYYKKGDDPIEGREQAVMTFTVARHYRKYGDENNSFDNVDNIIIDNLTSHDLRNGNIFWQIEKSKKKDGAFDIYFHTKPSEDEKNISEFILADDFDYLVAFAQGIQPNDKFVATINFNRNSLMNNGNTVLPSGFRLRQPILIEWKLGPNPQPSRGFIHEIAPPKSFCISDQKPILGLPDDSVDFPARITYAASYHIYVNNTRFVSDQSGVAVAIGVHEIPPRDVKVAFEKPFKGRYFSFSHGTCTGMREISEKEYREGVLLARYFRKTRLDVQNDTKLQWPPDITF